MKCTRFVLIPFLFSTLLLSSAAAADKIPVVRPEVIMEITDISGDFFFQRPYEPVPFIKEETDDEMEQELASQVKREFFNDIQAITMHGTDLLVFTSTLEPEKAVLVDVFNRKGEFQESFYLNLPELKRPDDMDRRPICFGKDCLWTVTTDEDENPQLTKMTFHR